MKFIDEFKECYRKIFGNSVGGYRAIDINLAARIYFENMDEMSFADVSKNMAPVFDKYWFEYDVPQEIIQTENFGEIDLVTPGIERVGFLVETYEMDQMTSALDLFNSMERKNLNDHDREKMNNVKWVSEIVMIFKIKKLGIQPIVRYKYLIDESGNILNLSNCTTILVENRFRSDRPSFIEILRSQDWSVEDIARFTEIIFARPALFANSLLHCKNIRQVEHVFDKKEDRESRKRTHKKKEALTKYYILDIEPIKSKTKGMADQVETDEEKLQRACHICRGHFRDYIDKGLFGKYYGTFYIPWHVRGNKQNGEVEKDYRIDI